MRTINDSIKEPINLEFLVGEHILSGCDIDTEQVLDWGETHVSAGIIRFVLDDKIYEAVENPDDGYRSSLEGLQLAEESVNVSNTFDPIKVLAVHRSKGNYGNSDDVLELRRISDGVLILEVGTESCDDYYPGCVMNFNLQGI